MLKVAFALLVATAPLQSAGIAASEAVPAHPEARPFNAKADAKAEVDAALTRAKAANKMTLIVMGANWCHDSRALAGWFAQPRFAAMLLLRYELVFVDVAYRDRNTDIARRFGIKSIKGTPTVMIVDANGSMLNKKDAASWHNASSRSQDAIYTYFSAFTAS